ncbi:TPA: AprI/Inh family metalloprotease inhibitor [Morganella morganii]|nr:AprI/Inh family metalloprotease inhibitor [Morganella morganii]
MFTLTLLFNAAGGRGRFGVRSIQEVTMQISRPSLLLFSLLLSGQSTAVSQRIPAAEELQGNWQFTEDGQTQPVTLTSVPDKTAEGFQLHFPGQPQISAWRPAPDGIAFITSDGTTRYFFSAESPGRYRAEIWHEKGAYLLKE